MVISVRRPHLDIGSSTNLKKGMDFGDDRRGQSHVGSAQSTEVLAKKGSSASWQTNTVALWLQQKRFNVVNGNYQSPDGISRNAIRL
jgi:hypothetical protein